MSLALLRSILFVFAAGVFLSGCAGYPPMNPFFSQTGVIPPPLPLEPPPAKKTEYWNGDGAKGEPTILVRLGEQRAYFYRGRKVVGMTRISTGKKGYATPAGSYSVIQKDKNHVSTLYGDYVGAGGDVVKSNVSVGKDPAPAGSTFRGAKMPYFLRFSGGHGLHSGRVPNYPASHGCVRLPAEMAKHFFENAEMGTPVRVEE
jgi:lipoprotein-anchoring transpeptidase ErfK/SrfK